MAPRKTTNSSVARLIEPLLHEPVERLVLPNGLTLILRADHSVPVASVQVWVKSGSIHEAPRLGSGVSHYLEHMLFKGTRKRAGRDISAVIQEHGGYINAYTSYDRTVYYIDVPSEHAALALDVLTDAVFGSTLPAAEVAKERDVILREIDMGLDDADYRVAQGLMEAAFREHPYRHPIIGHRDVFAKLGRSDLVDYYEARYQPNNAVIVVVGAIDPAVLRAEVERLVGAVPRARVDPVVVPDEPAQLGARRLDLQHDVQIYRAALGYQVPGLSHADTPALDVLALILGHGESSVLWHALREKRQIVQHVDATNWNPGTKGLFYVSLIADIEKGPRAVEAVNAELNRIRERGVTVAQLRRAVRQSLVAEVQVRRTMAGQASRLGVAEVVVGDLNYPAGYLSRLARLRPADIARVARDYLRPVTVTTATLGPRVTPKPAARPAATQRKSGLEFSDTLLPNHARLLVREDRRLPTVHLRVVWQGGSAFEPTEKRGATSLLATMLTKDTKKRSAVEVARAIEDVGGSFSDFAGNNSMGLAIEVLPVDLELALDLLAQAMLQPAFRPGVVQRERDAQLAELAEDNDDVVTVGRRRLRELFFGQHPLAVESGGRPETVGAITAKDLRALHRRLVVAGNTVLAVSGQISRRSIEPKLKRMLARLPRGRRPLVLTDASVPALTGVFTAPMDRQQVVVYEGYPAPGLMEEEFYVGEVLDELLSGMSSHLFERVREEKSLAYFVRSARVVGLRSGMLFLMAGTSPRLADVVVREFEAEITRLQKRGPAAGELKRCQTRLKAARRMSLQSNGACASNAALNALYGLPVNDWLHYDLRIDAVSVGAIRNFVRRYLKPKNRVRLLAGAARRTSRNTRKRR